MVPIRVRTKVEAARKYQLQVGSRVISIPAALRAWLVMPVRRGSVVPMRRFAEKPPDTPAKAAAIPASGCRPAMAKIKAPMGITMI